MTHGSGRFFEAIAGRYDRVYALSADESRRRMARVVQGLPPAPARVLDLGVGTGRELTALLDAGYAPTGVDVSPAMLARCARRARPVPLFEADFWQLPLPFDDGSFDAALALHGTLAHPPDDGAMARLAQDLARVVRPGGIFLAEIPSLQWLHALPPAPPPAGDRPVHRTGERTCRLEDRVVDAHVDARLLGEADWHAALSPAWHARIEAIDELEWLVIAVRNESR
ncbi:MAG: class I SAM-dependent methyltransferase [Polyangiaceae bacterium]|nr:class I SAM-dependent methyltransferase [Polyangiaceae bacterium]